MSDLCHNCGDCHLGSQPTPCPQPLNECIICKNWGHTFNFCPLSVRRADKDYQYWMICHNCDRWHLPRPCDSDLVSCPNCHNLGHLATFCPLYPNARLRPLGDSTVATKRQRTHSTADSEHTTASNGMPLIQDIKRIHPDLLQQIQVQAVSAFQQSGPTITQQQAINQQGRYIMPGYHSTPNVTLPAMQRQHGIPRDHQHQQQEMSTELQGQDLPTPVPSSAIKPAKPAAVVAAAHPRDADVREPPSQDDHANDDANALEAADVDLVKSAPVGKSRSGRKSRSQATPCASCKKAKKRCVHIANDATSSASAAPETEEDQVHKPKITKLKLSVATNFARENGSHAESTVNESGREDEHNASTAQRMDFGRLMNETPQSHTDDADLSIPFQQGDASGYSTGHVEVADAEAAQTYQSNVGDHRIDRAAYHGNANQMDWLQRSADSSMRPSLPATTSNTDAAVSSQHHTIYRGAYDMGGMHNQNLPSFQDVIGSDYNNPGNYLVHPGPMNSFADGSEAMHATTDHAFLTAQADSRRGGDVFSFGDNGKVDSFQDRHQIMGVVPTTESPFGQIQYEIPSPMDTSSMAPPETETETAAKPKKAASKKKSGGRKQKN